MAVERRTQDLQDAIGRVAAAMWPGDRARQDAICDDFDLRLDDEVESPDFLTLPINDLVRAYCTRLDLPDELAVRWRHLPLAPIWSDDEADPQPADSLSEAEPPISDTG